MNRSTPGLPVHHQLLEFTQTRVHRVSDAIQPSHPLLSSSPPAPIPPSIRVFSSESTLLMKWPKYQSFSCSIIPSKEIPGLISFRMDWLDLLAVQGTLKSLLQHHTSKASILWQKSTNMSFGVTSEFKGFPGGTSGKEHACQCRRPKRRKFNPWVRKILWRREWQPTPVFLPGESHGQKSLVGYSP